MFSIVSTTDSIDSNYTSVNIGLDVYDAICVKTSQVYVYLNVNRSLSAWLVLNKSFVSERERERNSHICYFCWAVFLASLLTHSQLQVSRPDR